MRNRWLAVPVLTAAAVIGLAACGSSNNNNSTSKPPAASPAAAGSTTSPSTSSGSSSASGIKTTTVSGHAVLTNAKGFVLYWFAPDTPTTSKCNGSCATYWPPLTGTPSFASGTSAMGKLGTIKRSDGTTQATYMGHPLYTYKADTSAGMDSGNGLNVSGGLWWAMTSSGAKIGGSGGGGASPKPSQSTSSGGYGY